MIHHNLIKVRMTINNVEKKKLMVDPTRGLGQPSLTISILLRHAQARTLNKLSHTGYWEVRY
jgi:hypothetical protein